MERAERDTRCIATTKCTSDRIAEQLSHARCSEMRSDVHSVVATPIRISRTPRADHRAAVDARKTHVAKRAAPQQWN
eukprot:3329379-Lingulodinium_polyedra.AAC.1